MPFDASVDWLREEVRAAGQMVGVEVERADDIFTAGVIVDQVKRRILEADAVIAVCTGHNPNVFYELGIAEQLHKPILLAEGSEDLPFDVKHFRAHFYGPAGDVRRKTLRDRVAAAIRQTIDETRNTAPAQPVPASLRILGQSMMHFDVAGLERKGSYERIPVDVVEFLKQIDAYERLGIPATDDKFGQGVPMLGRTDDELGLLAEGIGLATHDLDLAYGWMYSLTDKSRRLLNALRAWNPKIVPPTQEMG